MCHAVRMRMIFSVWQQSLDYSLLTTTIGTRAPAENSRVNHEHGDTSGFHCCHEAKRWQDDDVARVIGGLAESLSARRLYQAGRPTFCRNRGTKDRRR